MRPLNNEIVKGQDKQGYSFQRGVVLDSSATESYIRLSDGSDVTASHENIRSVMDGAGNVEW